MKKILAILLAGMMTTAALTGCAGSGGSTADKGNSNGETKTSESTGKNGVVDVADFGDEDNITLKVWAPDAAVKITKQQCEAFKELYPDKKIEITIVAQGEDTAATQMMNDPDASADVFGFCSDQLNKLVNAGVIAKCAYADQVTAANTEESLNAGIIDNKLYCYPETTNGYILVYDKRVVSDDQAKTFEGVLKACKDAGKQFIMDAGNGFYSCIFTFTGGVKLDGLEGEDNDIQKFTDYDEDTAVKTLAAFGKLFKDYKGTFTSLDVANISSGFSSGKCGAGIDGTWNAVVNEKALGDNLGVAKLPTINIDGKDVTSISMFGYKSLGVNGSSKFPRSSQILAYYLSGEECQRQRATEIGWGPTNSTVNGEDVVTQNDMLTAINEQSKNAVAQVNMSSTFWDPMKNLGNKIIAEEFKPDDTDAIKKLLDSTIANIRDE